MTSGMLCSATAGSCGLQAEPWATFLLPACLLQAVPHCPSSGRGGRAGTRLCCGRSLIGKLRTLKPSPKTASYVLGPVILWIWSQKFTLALLAQAAVGVCSFSLVGVCLVWYDTSALFPAPRYAWQECEWWNWGLEHLLSSLWGSWITAKRTVFVHILVNFCQL